MATLIEKPNRVAGSGSWLRRLLTPRTRPTLAAFDALALAIYAAILAFAIHYYQPFSDEAQEWLIARDCSLGQILLRRLHYEGHPPLWACFLWLLSRLHVPFAAINWISGGFALIGIYILLRYAPFPALFRYLLPFTFFLQYQYAAVARPYVLCPTLLFLLCILFTADRPRPVLFAVIAGVLANISLHAAILAIVFCLLYAHRLYRTRPQPTPSPRSLWTAAAIFCLFAACSAAVAFPAPDAVVAFTPNERVVKQNPWLQKLIPEETVAPSPYPLDAPLDKHSVAPKLDREKAAKYPAIVRLLIASTILGVGAGLYPIAKSNLLALLLLLCLMRWLWRRGCLRLMLPYAAVVLLSTHVFVFDHHTGLFLLALIAAVWIALGLPVIDPMPRARLRVAPVFAAVALVVLALQVGWTVHCIRSASLLPTDPGRQTAAFLTQNFSGKRVAGFGFESVSAQPYADHNLFFNWPAPYWIWSINVNTNRRRTEVLYQHPDAVVVDDVTGGPEVSLDQWFKLAPPGDKPYHYLLDFWQSHGYHRTHQFCGYQFRRMGVSYTFCEDILEPASDDARPGSKPQ